MKPERPSSREAGKRLMFTPIRESSRNPRLWPSLRPSPAGRPGRGRRSQAGRAEGCARCIFSRAPVGRLASQLEQNDDIQPYRPHCRRSRCDGAGSWASLCRRRCRQDQAVRGRQPRRGPERGRRRCLLFLHEQEDVSVGHAIHHHLGGLASERAKGMFRGSGREEHQIERADRSAPAGLAGPPTAWRTPDRPDRNS